MTERRYALVRLGPGDYLLPSNDGATLWRIYSYGEYGDAEWIVRDEEGQEQRKTIKGTFWACARWRNGGLPDLERVGDDELLDHTNWIDWSTTLRTRREAIEDALNAEPGNP